ncbi:Histone deacetylation protein Rxt3 [Dillenia turbinata]|uniref:Histone deacetylation protein Rxt3 n=1 Tax=Dillenia turbinata TaxID=194707 RepID=A0AAN8Z3C9_9MAGN
MSGVPKRLQDEGSIPGHGVPSKHPLPHEDTPPFASASPVNAAAHSSFELGPDARMPKVPRVESCDADRRSPLNTVYRVSPSLNNNDIHVENSAASDSRDSKDARDLKVDNRDAKPEIRELHVDPKRDLQGTKVEKDPKYESRGDDNKEIKHDREIHTDLKGDMKMEKDSSSHLNWKESKAEYNRGKIYNETSGGGMDPWVPTRSTVHGPTGLLSEERDCGETHETVSENKFDDKLKEKDRKRKDMKHREWEERDRERWNNLQPGNTGSDGKELSREERGSDRWEREKKDSLKDKERPKEREKDHIKKEAWIVPEKEALQSEKETVDTSVPMREQENAVLEQKKNKDFDDWKNADREGKDRRREKDADLEGDRPEKRVRSYDKESDDGCTDLDGGIEREREVFNYGVQQRKRMLRPRGSPQVANRDIRFRSHGQDTEGFQGKPEVSTVVYKVGECMQELIKLWKEYESSQVENNGESTNSGPTLEIRIPAEHVTATNRQLRGGQLWGTDIYTDDSDLVAVLMHTGYCRPTASPPPPAIQELRATIRVLPPQDCYISTLRNNVRSRAWGAAIGCSYRVERCCIVKKGGGTIDLEPCLTHSSTVEPTLAPVAVERTMTTRAAASVLACNAIYVTFLESFLSALGGLIAYPATFDFRMRFGNRDMYVKSPSNTTCAMSLDEAIDWGRGERLRLEAELDLEEGLDSSFHLITFSLIKYSISIVADKGLKKPLYTSARLKKGEVLYLESHTHRYELCFAGEKFVKATGASQGHEAEAEMPQSHSLHSANGDRHLGDSDNVMIDVFRWSHCKKPLPQKVMRSLGVPLPLEHVEALYYALPLGAISIGGKLHQNWLLHRLSF